MDGKNGHFINLFVSIANEINSHAIMTTERESRREGKRQAEEEDSALFSIAGIVVNVVVDI